MMIRKPLWNPNSCSKFDASSSICSMEKHLYFSLIRINKDIIYETLTHQEF